MTLSGQGPPTDPGRHPGNDNRVAEELLQAYVDGQLPANQRARIESFLASQPSELDRLVAYHKQNIGLHALFDGQDSADGAETLPAPLIRMAKTLDKQLEPSRRPQLNHRALAAGLALMMAAGAGGWLGYSQLTAPSDPLVALTRQAAEAHDRPANAQVSKTATAVINGHQVIAWLSEQPQGAALKLPDLESLGFRLVADRVMPTAAGKRAAQLLYQDEDGRRVTLYMRADPQPADQTAAETSFTFRREGAVSQFFWQSGAFAYSLIGMMEQEQLLEIAEVISEELQAGGHEAGSGKDESAPATPSTQSRGLEAPHAPQSAQKPAVERQDADKTGGNKPGEQTPLGSPERLPLQPLPVPLPEADAGAEET